MKQTTYALDFRHTVHAPRAIVCRAWTDAEQLKGWYRPDDSWSTPVAEIDLRAGGKYRIGLQPPVGSTFYEVGIYREVALPDRLVYTVRFEGVHLQFKGGHLDEPTGAAMERYETVITVAFHELASGGTRVVAQNTERGWVRIEPRYANRERSAFRSSSAWVKRSARVSLH